MPVQTNIAAISSWKDQCNAAPCLNEIYSPLLHASKPTQTTVVNTVVDFSAWCAGYAVVININTWRKKHQHQAQIAITLKGNFTKSVRDFSKTKGFLWKQQDFKTRCTRFPRSESPSPSPPPPRPQKCVSTISRKKHTTCTSSMITDHSSVYLLYQARKSTIIVHNHHSSVKKVR